MMEYEAERHSKSVRDEMGVGAGSKGLDQPLVHEAAEREYEELAADEVPRFRALIATATAPASTSGSRRSASRCPRRRRAAWRG